MRSCEEAVIRRHLLLTKTSDQAEKRRVQWRLGGVGPYEGRELMLKNQAINRSGLKLVCPMGERVELRRDVTRMKCSNRE